MAGSRIGFEHSFWRWFPSGSTGLRSATKISNDHEQLRKDPLFGVLAGRDELDKPLAGKSTLNRLELGNGQQDRYKKITFWKQAIDELLVSVFIESHEKAPEEIILDVDTTDLPLHGKQEGASFMATTIITATCRCMSSAVNMSCAHGFDRPTAMLRQEAWPKSNESLIRYERHGRQ